VQKGCGSAANAFAEDLRRAANTTILSRGVSRAQHRRTSRLRPAREAAARFVPAYIIVDLFLRAASGYSGHHAFLVKGERASGARHARRGS
jgi:hypothetical protein